MNQLHLALLSGDGIGEAAGHELDSVLHLLADRFGFKCRVTPVPFGRKAYDTYGIALPEASVTAIREADAALFAAVDSSGIPGTTPVGLLRRQLGLYADVRPIRSGSGRQALRPDIDLVFIRETTQGFLSDRNLYAGNGEWMSDENTAFSLRVISYEASRRIADFAFSYARTHGRKKVTAIHKVSIFKMTCGTFLRACRDSAVAYPEITYEEEVADSTANGLVAHPQRYDVILTTNLFGDVLSDEAAALVGDLAPSVNIGAQSRVYSPISHSPAYSLLAADSYDPIPPLLCLQTLLEDLGQAQAAAALGTCTASVAAQTGIHTTQLWSQLRASLEEHYGNN